MKMDFRPAVVVFIIGTFAAVAWNGYAAHKQSQKSTNSIWKVIFEDLARSCLTSQYPEIVEVPMIVNSINNMGFPPKSEPSYKLVKQCLHRAQIDPKSLGDTSD